MSFSPPHDVLYSSYECGGEIMRYACLILIDFTDIVLIACSKRFKREKRNFLDKMGNIWYDKGNAKNVIEIMRKL